MSSDKFYSNTLQVLRLCVNSLNSDWNTWLLILSSEKPEKVSYLLYCCYFILLIYDFIVNMILMHFPEAFTQNN